MNKQYIASRIDVGLMALLTAAATIPAYGNPTSNPGMISLADPAQLLGETAAAFLVRRKPCAGWNNVLLISVKNRRERAGAILYAIKAICIVAKRGTLTLLAQASYPLIV